MRERYYHCLIVKQEALIEQVIAQLNVKQTEDRVRQKTGPEKKLKTQNLRFAQDVTQARDEVGKSIQAIQQTGLHVEHKDKDHEDYYEIKIRIYKNVSSRHFVYMMTNT